VLGGEVRKDEMSKQWWGCSSSLENAQDSVVDMSSNKKVAHREEVARVYRSESSDETRALSSSY